MNISFQLSWTNFSLSLTHTTVLYQILENRSSNHKAYNHIVTTTVTFVMKYIIVSKDPTQNNTGLFTWKSILEYDKATFKIECFVLAEEKIFAWKIISNLQLLQFLRSKMTGILLTFTSTLVLSNMSLENCGWLINEGGTRKKESFFEIFKYRCYISQYLSQ